MSKHKNDIYGDIAGQDKRTDVAPPIPAATVLLLRDSPDLEVLMLHKTSKISFGGMWVFPGGKIDQADFVNGDDPDEAARHAAMRETHEEAGIQLPKDAFVWFAHWTPPPITPKRFATWFFATAAAEDHAITIDGGEIQDHQWLKPAVALAQHAQGEIDLAPPTWVSLYQLSKFSDSQTAIQKLDQTPTRYYKTKIAQDQDGHRVAMWSGDAGYDAMDAEAAGERHRLIMKPGGFEFEHSAIEY